VAGIQAENVENLALCYIICSVADPGSGVLRPLNPVSGMGGKIRIRDEEPGSFSESLETIFCITILKFFDADPDPGSGIFLTLDPE
jgi:hypothetical protein